MTDVIIFLDALSPRETTGFLDEIRDGNMDSGVPRVTPRVMSSIYTGLNPAENGMMEVSKHGGQDVTRPKKSTFIDQMVREEMSVLSMGMPFCIPFQNANENSLLHGTALGGQQQVLPEEMGMLANVPAPDADYIQDHPDRVYASSRDQTTAFFATFKENIRRIDPDVALLGYRLIDSYCHFQHTETREGQSYREHLIDEVAGLVKSIHQQIDGDVLWFSDHGQTELTDVFRVNRWLKQNGYLDYKVDYDFQDTLQQAQGENHPIDARVENQVTEQQPGVVVNEDESDVICSDPFDSSLTLLTDRDKFDTEAFRNDLLATGMYRDVTYRWEKYNEDADFYNTVPHVLPDRAEGVFVSGNMHEQPIGMGYYRSGVHDWKACYGATCELSVPHGMGRNGCITPEQMYNVIRDFIGLDLTTNALSSGINQYTAEELELMRDGLDNRLEGHL